MKKNIYAACLSLMFFVSFNLYSQGSSRPSGGGTQAGGGGIGPSTIVRPPLGPHPGGTGLKGSDTKIELPPKAPEFSFRPTFTQPGIVALRGESGFVGTDHLYNVTGNIPVVVDIVKSESLQISFSQDQIQEMVEKAFQKEGIDPNIKPSTGPALPFFQILVMIVPSGEGVTAFCSGRLFEKVSLDRVILPPDVYFQAITWEFQNLIFSSKEDMQKQVEVTVAEIAQEFLSRYKYYKTITAPQ